MTAFICCDRLIPRIAVNYCILTKTEGAQGIADKLKEINIASVNWRYPNHKPEPVTPCSLGEVHDLSFPDLVALCECLDYQSCEPPDYKNPLLDAITDRFKANVRHGVKSRMWSI